MFSEKWKLALILAIIAGISFWILDMLTDDETVNLNKLAHHPDYYMENFTTLTMNQDGKPKNRLNAEYMAHYQDDETSELNKPEFEIYKQDQEPIVISADKGWVTSNNDVILLNGNVYLYQNDAEGNTKLELIAEDAKILVDEKYAETDNEATLINGRTVTRSIGMRAYMDEQRLEFLNDVHTTIEPRQTQ